MTIAPYALLRVSLNGGGIVTGGITAALSDSVQLSADPAGLPGATSVRFEIYDYPSAFAVPAGWSTAADGTYFYVGTTPPAFAVSPWGKYMLRLILNGGISDVASIPSSQLTTTATAVRVLSPAGLRGWAAGETSQWGGSEQWVADQKADTETLALATGAASNGQLSAALAAATGNVTLSGAQTLDGVACVAGNRVFLGFQTAPAQNGPWIVQSGAWTRPTDFDVSGDVISGQTISVVSGATYGGRQFMLTSVGPFVLGTTALTWSLIGAGGSTSAGGDLSVHYVIDPANTAHAHSGTTAVDGTALTAGSSRILDTSHATPALRGIWLANAGAWTRPADYDSDGDVAAALTADIRVTLGTARAGTRWTQSAGTTVAGSKTFAQLVNANDKPKHDRVHSRSEFVAPATEVVATDTAELVAVIAAARTTGKVIDLQPGEYHLNAELDLNGGQGIHIRGAARGSSDLATGTHIYWDGARGVDQYMLGVDASQNVVFENIHFFSNLADGVARIHLTSGQPTNIKFVDCRFSAMFTPTNTSTDSRTVGAGSFSFTLNASAAAGTYPVGSMVGAFSRSTGAAIVGTVTSASGTNCTFTAIAAENIGTGTYTDWDIIRVSLAAINVSQASCLSTHSCVYSGYLHAWKGSVIGGTCDNTNIVTVPLSWAFDLSGGSSPILSPQLEPVQWRAMGIRLVNVAGGILSPQEGDTGNIGPWIDMAACNGTTIAGAYLTLSTAGQSIVKLDGCSNVCIPSGYMSANAGYIVDFGAASTNYYTHVGDVYNGGLGPFTGSSHAGTTYHDTGGNPHFTNLYADLLFSTFGVLVTRSDISLSNGKNNDVGGVGSGCRLRVTGPTAAWGVSGIQNAASDGVEIELYSDLAYSFTVYNEDAASTAGYRIRTPTGTDLTFPAGPIRIGMKYSGFYSRWQVTSVIAATDTLVDYGSSGASKTLDLRVSKLAKLTLTADCTLTITRPQIPSSGFIHLVQDSTPRTVTWDSAKFGSGVAPTLSAGSGALDVFSWYYDGTNLYVTPAVQAAA